MMKCLLFTGAMLAVFSTSAFGDDRYATRPPVVLSPDLTAPWVMQLGGAQVRPVVYPRPAVTYRQQPAQRQVLFAPRTQRAAPNPQQPATAPDGIPVIRGTIEPQFLPQMVEYKTKEVPGTIVIDTNNRFLYLVLDGGKARRYGVGVGKPGFEWAGEHRITRKAEWPDWTPPAEMVSREAAKGHYLPARMDGGPANPLGARAMYLGSSLYRIHGTNAPWTIGSAVSSGCIRMRNQDVVDLYERVKVGTRVIVM
ncbi:L,D-transpeptidase [Oryzifoliimicrobium ureilyticus]|uniref:L,D-transpeptidase n=1 Tax=Oryzifoliimicrobium ureilyticus TaxID=3113724 RepID=UPI0030765F07